MTSSTDTRNTRQRDIILEEICKVCTHPTAKDVYGMVKKRMPSIGLATVYRGLDRLEKEGKILKLKSKGKEARYDGNAGGHCHLICKDCGCIDDIFDIQTIQIDSKELEKTGFKPELDFLEISGICKKCQKIKS